MVLKNGRTMDCIILAEKADHVEISLGTGSMNIPRNQIKQLIRTKSRKNTTAPSLKGNILSEQHAPAEYADLAAEFRVLMNRRNTAYDAQYMTNYYTKEIRKLNNKIKKLQNEASLLNAQLSEKRGEVAAIQVPDQPPRKNKDARIYNQKITERNQLKLEADVLYSQIPPLIQDQQTALQKIVTLQNKQKTLATPIGKYLKDLAVFSSAYKQVKSTQSSPADSKSKEFFSKIDRLLTQFETEMNVVSIPATSKGHHTVVRALVNGSATGDFIFDTGASIMTISESFAKQLGLNLENLAGITAIVADGREVKARSATLSQVTVGSATVDQVEVLVMPSKPNAHADGLLGMSFLKHFSVNINGASGEIELTRFHNE
ncbi:retropepsin-like aspartic protease [Pontiellaceae bacterium B12227]|nr:retropepsin-like aspartic protease [Pontiellaceae bacterium B12227]